MQTETASLAGRWVLVASAASSGQVVFFGDEPDPNGVSDWLNGLGHELDVALKGASGLELEITPDARFSEIVTGQPAGHWFDVEGVLANDIQPLAGTLVPGDGRAWLQPQGIPSWSVHGLNRYRDAVLRYDDGDTKICDVLRIQGTRLHRVVNVVTDELYTHRQLVAYERRA